MRGRLFGLLPGAAVGLLLAAGGTLAPASAAAHPVLVMGHNGHVRRADDRFLAVDAPTPTPDRTVRSAPDRPPTAATASRAPAPKKPKKPRKPKPTVPSELSRLYRTGQIDSADYSRYSASWSSANAAAKHLRGTPAFELRAVIANLQGMAAAGAFAPTRLPALFLTLDRNQQWWSSGPLLGSGQEVEFTGSNLVWEYYPGQGLELQVLATFGKADGLYTAGASQYSQMRALLQEMIPLAVDRAGGLAWEYYFHFDGGSPPWVSAMAQGTGLEALTRAAQAFGKLAGPDGSSGPSYLQIGASALGIFRVPPPLGVQAGTPAGARYLQYSFAPHTDIINAFLQSLIGLYDYGHLSGNQEAQQLFAAGNAQAEVELPGFDTGAWSLYQPGVEDSLDYHVLVSGFLDQLCSRTGAPVYCSTAQHFHLYMKIPPALRLLSTRATSGRHFNLRFSLSKYSHVGIVVTRGQQSALRTSADFGYGTDAFTVPALKAGSYQVVLTATDLPGNYTRTVGSLQVSQARRST